MRLQNNYVKGSRPELQNLRRLRRKGKLPVRKPFSDLVNKMTNAERSVWARAGYPRQNEDDVLTYMPRERLRRALRAA